MLRHIVPLLLLISFLFQPFSLQSAQAGTVQLFKTGQTKCYDPSSNTWNEISCSGTGQDGDKQAGVAWPSPRFSDNNDGTVTDNLTGLIWLKNANCKETVGGIAKTEGNLVWQDALTWSNNLASGFCGLTDGTVAGDWRLPNPRELLSLVDRQNRWPSLPSDHLFTDVQGFNWTSSSYKPNTTYAIFVNIDTGTVINNPKTAYSSPARHYVWPVRGGQSSLSASPAVHAFGSLPVLSSSAPQTVTLVNNGASDIVVSSISTAGSDSSMFTVDTGDGTGGTCGTTPTLAPAGSCTVTVTFSPTNTGARSSALRIRSNDAASPKDIGLSGTGEGYTISTSVIGGNGTIDCQSPVAPAASSNCTISPSAHYHLATFTDNGDDKLSSVTNNSYTINAVSTDHAISGSFAVNSYTVTFESNGGGTVNSQTVVYNTTATEPVAPIKTGSTFDGWFSDSGLTTPFNFATPVTADITLYAKWIINSYTVSFESNEGSAVSSQTVNYNATATEPAAPTRTGYTFGGWFSDSGLTAAFNFATPVTADITLYAKWTINSYTVTFDSNGGGTVSSQTVVYNTSATEPVTPTKTGSTFGGWFSDSGLTAVFNFATPVTADITLYAKWISGSYTAPKAKVASTDYTGAQAAYSAAGTTSGSVIKLLEGTLVENFTADRNITVTLDGGYNTLYEGIQSETTINGVVTLKSGTTIIAQLRIK